MDAKSKEIELINISVQYNMAQIWKHTITSKVNNAIKIIYTNNEKLTPIDLNFSKINEYIELKSELIGIANEMLFPNNYEIEANWHFE